jgi:esterase/lipase superfamily enzyme
VGLFSPVLHKEQVPSDTTIQYTIITGQVDIFFASGDRFRRRLKRAHCPHQLIALEKGGHNWRTWRTCFPMFLELKDQPK